MPSVAAELSERFAAVAGIDPEIRPATKPEFGHYQTNVALRLAKTQGRKPREVAQQIIDDVELADWCEPLEIAGPGFINIRLSEAALVRAINALLADPRHGVGVSDAPQTVVVDYGGPNVAKQMHVGHLRSTIIGDCFARVLAAVGHTVIAQNHIGDWGTQFGMLVELIDSEGIDPATLDLAAAAALYQRANQRDRSDPEFAAQARKRVVALQAGDPHTVAVWRSLIALSTKSFNQAFARLGVLLTDDDVAGESSYNDDLPVISADLEQRGVAVIDQGALCVFVPGIEAPLIIRKSDGGYGYATTDLAAIRRRVNDFHAQRLIYVTDVRQSSHFAQVFAVSRKAGYLPPEVTAEHIGYGMVLGKDGKPFKTREGTAATLDSLLDTAESFAARPIAMGAIKYADLSSGLGRDYVFDVDRMVQTTGNTGPYLQYAHARLNQVLAKAQAETPEMELSREVVELSEPAEQALALQLSRFGDAVEEVAATLQPHRLCTYLYELAVAVAKFYDDCPVLRSEEATRQSRLALCLASREVLATGLDLLGIQAPARM